jgi:DNA-binding MarR family transcriptional regulator
MRESRPPKSKSPTRESKKFPVDSSIGYQIRVAHRLLQRYRQVLVEPYGVTAGMWFFLRVLWDEDGLTQRELSDRVGTMEPTTLVALRAMKKARLIQRIRNTDDKRKVNIFLTPKGRALEETLVPLAKHVVDHAVADFSQAEIRQLLSMLKRIQTNLAEIDKARPEEIEP